MKMIRTTISFPLLTAALALAVGAPSWAQAPESLRTAVIDVQRILAESEAGKKEIARIKKTETEKAERLKGMEAEINKLKEKLTDLGFSISEAERTRLTRQIEDKVIDGERFRKDSVRQIKGLYEDVLADFEKRVGPIIKAIGQERGIHLILHRDNPAIAWADKSIDITDEVIARFNKNADG